MAQKGIFVSLKVCICTIQSLHKPSAKVQFLEFLFIQNSKYCVKSIYRRHKLTANSNRNSFNLSWHRIYKSGVGSSWLKMLMQEICLFSTITGSYFASNLENSPAAFCNVVKLKIFNRPRCESFHVCLWMRRNLAHTPGFEANLAN